MSARETISYFERPPRPSLAWAVKAFWSLEGHLVNEAAALPKPYVEIVVSLADGHWWHAGQAAPQSFREGWITPLQSGPRYSRAQGATSFVGARLEPNAAVCLFGQLPLGDGTAPFAAEAVLGSEFRTLRDRLGEAVTHPERLTIMEAWLDRRLARLRPERFPFRARPTENWRVDALCDQLGLGDREARRSFQREFGCSPKYWLRLHRLAAIIACPCFQTMGEPLADTAARFGLADQAHLAREFRLLAGMSPSGYQQGRKAAELKVAPSMAPARLRRFFQADC